MDQNRQQYYIREYSLNNFNFQQKAVSSIQPLGNNVILSRNNSLANIQNQGNSSIPLQNNISSNIISMQATTTPNNQGLSSAHSKQQSIISNISSVKNQYIINVTHDSSLMTVADMNNQRKTLSILTSQQSQLKELFRNKAQTPTHVSSRSQQFNAPYLKDNYFLKHPDHQTYQSNIASRSKIFHEKFNGQTNSNSKRRQNSCIIESKNQFENVENNQVNMINKSSSNLLNKSIRLEKQNPSMQNSYQVKSAQSMMSKEQIRHHNLQKIYIQSLQKCELIKDTNYNFETFKYIIHNFQVNDALISNIELPKPPPNIEDEVEKQKNQELLNVEKQNTDMNLRNFRRPSYSQLNKQIGGINNNQQSNTVNDQQFITELSQETSYQKQNKTNQYQMTNQDTSFVDNIKEGQTPKVQFNKTNNDTSTSGVNSDKQKITINIINTNNDVNSKTEINTFDVTGSQKAISSEESGYQKQIDEVQDPFKEKSKEEILMLLMDFLMNIEQPFKEGMSYKYYPQQSFLQKLMKSIMEMSNKICHYLMQKKEKVVCVFINQLLKMLTQIFERQFSYIKNEIRTKVDLQVKEVNDKFDFFINNKAELEDKISKMYKEQDKMQQEFQKKILNMEEIKNQYLEQAEILKEQIEESRTKKYKDYQLERIQIQSKEVIKNCAMIEAEIMKRKEESKDSIQCLAKLTAEHFSMIKTDPRRKSLLGNIGGINQSDILVGMNSMHSENQQSFAEFNQITFSSKYDMPESRSSILFSHPFQFYIKQDIQNYLYDKLVPKMSRSEMIKMLENFMEEVTYLKQEGSKISGPTNFIHWILQKYNNFFVASIKITEVSFLLQNLVNARKDIGIFFATVFGILQDNMLSDQQFEYMIQVRKLLKYSTKLLEKVNELSESDINNIIEDNIYIPAKLVSETFLSVFKNHPQYTKLEEKLNLFLKTKKTQINQKAIQEQRKIINSKFGESSLTLIPNLMEKMKTENINDVIRSLENIFTKLDIKKQDRVNYLSFKKLMYNHYGIETENDSFSEYFTPFIQDTWFIYPGFISKVITLHVPDSVNDKLITYYCVVNEICNLLLHNQNQSFHEFKNKLSNYLFNIDQFNVFQFNNIEEFFKSYENSKDDHLKYNSKRISPALLYQYLFRQNEFAQMYQHYKLVGKVDDTNDEIIRRLYPQRQMIDNFNEFLEYNRNIYQFLQVQEKISIIQAITISETNFVPSQSAIKSKTNLQKQATTNKLKRLKTSKIQQQNSIVSNKSSPSNQQINRKSLFQKQATNSISKQGTNYFQKLDSIDLDISESKESVGSPDNNKKSIFSGV